MIRVHNKQTGERAELDGVGTVRDLLIRLGLVEGQALVVRDGELLTRDIRLADGDSIEIIPVVSGG